MVEGLGFGGLGFGGVGFKLYGLGFRARLRVKGLGSGFRARG